MAGTERPRLHVVYEHGVDYRPYSSSFIRLLRPLRHDRVRREVDVTFGLDFPGGAADIVIVDRFWRPSATVADAAALVERVRQADARLVYSLDDNIFDLAPTGDNRADIAALLLRHADACFVSTTALRTRLLGYNGNIEVIPNELDESLLVARDPNEARLPFRDRPLVIGYQGTLTHDDDLRLVHPALESVCRRHPRGVQIQVVGVIADEATRRAMADLPVRYVYPRPEEHEYPLFMVWFTGTLRWDVAISPLVDTPFTRCKSDVKFLDYAALGAAGIFSRSPAYEPNAPGCDSVRNAETGLVVENDPAAWEDALERLLRDAELRARIAGGASKFLHEHRTLAHRSGDWLAAVTKWMTAPTPPTADPSSPEETKS